jgi:hypothetical protein
MKGTVTYRDCTSDPKGLSTQLPAPGAGNDSGPVPLTRTGNKAKDPGQGRGVLEVP